MSVLLLRFAGPMQSWGAQSRFSVRDTGTEPSKSGVIGLLCAAMGRPRSAKVDDLVALRMGVRVDREGAMKRDYHTAMNVAKAGGGVKNCELSTRYYLADADFLVGLEASDEELLSELAYSLENPKWQIYLGRKAFTPAKPVYAGRADGSVESTLSEADWHARTARELERTIRQIAERTAAGEPLRLRAVFDAPFGTSSEVRCDVPLSFAEREFTIRHVETRWIELTSDMVKEDALCISHA